MRSATEGINRALRGPLETGVAEVDTSDFRPVREIIVDGFIIPADLVNADYSVNRDGTVTVTFLARESIEVRYKGTLDYREAGERP